MAGDAEEFIEAAVGFLERELACQGGEPLLLQPLALNDEMSELGYRFCQRNLFLRVSLSGRPFLQRQHADELFARDHWSDQQVAQIVIGSTYQWSLRHIADHYLVCSQVLNSFRLKIIAKGRLLDFLRDPFLIFEGEADPGYQNEPFAAWLNQSYAGKAAF